MEESCQDSVKRFDDAYSQQAGAVLASGGQEMRPLDEQVRRLQQLLVGEQDKYARLAAQLRDSEAQRLELISRSNKEVGAFA